MSDRIVMRTGEALVEGDEDYLCAEPEVVIGELDGPVGIALATLMGDQAKGHTKVFAILGSDVQVRPATLMVSKVTVKDSSYTNILMGTVQAAIANGVLDAVRAGDIPRDKVNDLGIIYSVWLDPSVTKVDVDHEALFAVHREATAKVIRKAMAGSRRSSGCWRIRTRWSIIFTSWGLRGSSARRAGGSRPIAPWPTDPPVSAEPAGFRRPYEIKESPRCPPSASKPTPWAR